VGDLGVVEVSRYDGTTYQDFWCSATSTGTRLQYNDSVARAFRSSFFSGTAFTAVSNSTAGNVVTTVYATGASGNQVVVTQTVTYTAPNDFFDIRWSSQNDTQFGLSDIRFFYGGGHNPGWERFRNGILPSRHQDSWGPKSWRHG
jgi:hypothetical protein